MPNQYGEIFIQRSKEVHNNKYDYHLVEYVNSGTKVKIICPEHGIFEQQPNNHLYSKQGCPKCGIIKRSKSQSLGTEKFIELSKGVHGDRYDYSKVIYKNNRVKVEIICRDHGNFWQFPSNHLKGHNCNQCVGFKQGRLYSLTTDEFIAKARKIHKDKYSYEKTRYFNYKASIQITCPKHGPFSQTASAHLRGGDCPFCSSSKGEKIIYTYLVNMGLHFEYQKRFKSCKGKITLPFDFYFQIGERRFLIEYDGELHYEPSRYRNGKKKFKITQRHDAIKTRFAKDNGFILIRVPYTIKNIELFLQNEIEKHIEKSLQSVQAKVTYPKMKRFIKSFNLYKWQQLELW